MRASSDLSDLSSYWKDQRSAHRRMGVVKSVVLGRVVHRKVPILVRSKYCAVACAGWYGTAVAVLLSFVVALIVVVLVFGWLLSTCVSLLMFLSLSGLGKHENDFKLGDIGAPSHPTPRPPSPQGFRQARCGGEGPRERVHRGVAARGLLEETGRCPDPSTGATEALPGILLDSGRGRGWRVFSGVLLLGGK